MRLSVILTLLVCLLAVENGTASSEPEPVGPSKAGWVNHARKSVPDTERRRSVGAFCASLLITDDPNIFANWDKRSEVFAYQGIDSIEKGAFFVAVVAFANPSVDAAGNAHLVADFSLLRPDGSLYGEMKDMQAWDGPPPKENILELTTKYLKGRLEPGDPLGTYQVVATIQDQVSGKKLELRAPLLGEPSASQP